MSWFPKKSAIAPVDFSTTSADALKTVMTLVEKPEGLQVIYKTALPNAFNHVESWALDDPAVRRMAAHEQLTGIVEANQAIGAKPVIREGSPGPKGVEDALPRNKLRAVVVTDSNFLAMPQKIQTHNRLSIHQLQRTLY